MQCIMSDDAEYLANYRIDEFYVHPSRDGAFARIVAEGGDVPVGEIGVT